MYTDFQTGQAVPAAPVQMDLFDSRPKGKGLKIRLSTEERFQAMLKRRKNGCIEFTGEPDITTGGYCKFRVGPDKMEYAHRYAWQTKYGDIPAGLQIRHSCHNTICCNTNHHSLGTHLENQADKIARGSKSRRINKEQAPLIAKMHYENGRKVQDLAKLYNVGSTTVRNLLIGKTHSQSTGIVFRPAKPYQRKLKEAA